VLVRIRRSAGSWRPPSLRPASLGVFAVLVLAGVLFAVSAATARGTQLRTDRADAVAFARGEQARYAARLAELDALRREVDERTRAEAGGNSVVRSLRAQAATLAPGAGLAPVSGRTLTVTLDDAPRRATLPAGAKPDDLVVHQQDVQAVVNALWHGGAEAMMLQDQRVISTSAVRCVGNTLILQGRVYSPPYRISAIGDPVAMRAALESASAIQIYQEFARVFGLGWQVEEHGESTFPAYTGALDLHYATVQPGPGSSATGATSGSPSASGSATSSTAAPSGSPSAAPTR
jgi:uncharacterized protein YlxW (UPF0749 family)